MTDHDLYYIGNPCKRGHAPLRYRSKGDCVQCARDRSKMLQRDIDAKDFWDDEWDYSGTPLSQLSDGFKENERIRNGVSAEQAAADRLLLAEVHKQILTEALKSSVDQEEKILRFR